MRVNLSVALVAMVNTSLQAQNNATTDYCPGSDVSDNSTATHVSPNKFDEGNHTSIDLKFRFLSQFPDLRLTPIGNKKTIKFMGHH